MSVRVQCPNPECGASLSLSVEALGRRGRCPACGSRFVVSASMDGAVASARFDPPGTTSAPNSTPSERLGRYEIREKLGSGAFGTVYRAYDPVMDREIALKVPREGLLETPTAVERFLREARAAARLRHPHIVPAHDAGSEDGRYYIASAFVRGRTLAQAIGEQGLEPRLAARIVRELADALQHAHELGIVHRDVKPANVILDPDGHAHLMDFGLARLSGTESAKLTQVGSILGTPAYIAPEQATGRAAEADPAGDQYSLGVTLFELLTGQTPFVGPIEVVLFATIHQPPPTPSSFNPAVPPDLEVICLKALAKKPGDRYLSCRGMADDLGRWLDGSSISASPKGPEPPPITTAPSLLPIALRNLALGDDNSLLIGDEDASRKSRKQGRPDRIRPGRRTIALAALPVLSLALLGMIAATSLRPSPGPPRPGPTPIVPKHRALGPKPVIQTDEAAKPPTSAIGARAEPSASPEPPKREVASTIPPVMIPVVPQRGGLDSAERARREVGYDKIGLAYQAWLDHAEARGLEILEEIPAADRGWEWGYCRRACRRSSGPDPPPPVGQPRRNLKGESVWEDAYSMLLFQPRSSYNVAISDDGRYICGGSLDGPVRVWDSKDWDYRDLEGHPGTVSHAVAFGPGGARIVSGGHDHRVKVWDRASLTLLEDFDHGDEVYCVAFSPDGRRVASGGKGSHIRLWNLESGATGSALDGHSGTIRALAFSPDGRWIASGSEDHRLHLWDAAHGSVVFRFDHGAAVQGVAFSPDGRRIASAGDDGTIQVLDVATRQPTLTLRGHDGEAFCVAFSPDGRRIASGGRDKLLRLWDSETGRPILAIREHFREILGVAYSPDGRRIVTAGFDAKLRVWESE